MALTGYVKPPRSTEAPTYFALSGFVVSVRGLWFLVTAGHALAEIEQRKREGYEFVRWSLDDTFARRKKRQVNVDGPGAPDTVPFSFDEQMKTFYFNEENGTDFGFIYLRDFYEAQLKEDVLPFQEEHWTFDVDRSADKVELIGIPTDQIVDLKVGGLVQKSLVSIPLHRVADDFKGTPGISFVLQAVTPDITKTNVPNFKHIRGMSGGPIVGFWNESDGTVTTRILALQSRWDPHSKTATAYPIEGVIPLLQHLVEPAYQEWLAQRDSEMA